MEQITVPPQFLDGLIRSGYDRRIKAKEKAGQCYRDRPGEDLLVRIAHSVVIS